MRIELVKNPQELREVGLFRAKFLRTMISDGDELPDCMTDKWDASAQIYSTFDSENQLTGTCRLNILSGSMQTSLFSEIYLDLIAELYPKIALISHFFVKPDLKAAEVPSTLIQQAIESAKETSVDLVISLPDQLHRSYFERAGFKAYLDQASIKHFGFVSPCFKSIQSSGRKASTAHS